MASADAIERSPTSPVSPGERLAAIEAEHKHMATRADIERLNTAIEKQSDKLLAWLIGTQIALFITLSALINALLGP